MTPTYGWEGQIGWGDETSWGTPATINRFAPFISESLRLEIDRLVSPGIRGGRGRRSEEVVPGRKNVTGDVVFDLWAKGLGLWFKHALGSVTSAQQGGTSAYLHTFSLTDALPPGLTVEIKKGGTQFHKYSGVRVDRWTIGAAINAIPRMTFTVLGKDESISGSGATASYPSGNELLSFHQGIFKIDTSQVDIYEFELTLNNNLADSDYRLGAPTRASLLPRSREVTGRFRLPYDAVTEYTKFRNFTPAALNLKFTGSLIQGSYYVEFTIDLPVVHYDGSTPATRGAEEEVSLEVPFRAVRGTDLEMTVTLQNTETAP